MRIAFTDLTVELFDAIFDPSLSRSDKNKAYNAVIDDKVRAPLRHIDIEVNDAMLQAGVRAALDIKTYGDPKLYEEEIFYRVYVAMERVRLAQQVLPQQGEDAVDEE